MDCLCDCTPLVLSKIDLISWTTIMAARVFAKKELLTFDKTGDAITLNYVGQPVDHAKNVVTTTTADWFQKYWAPPSIAIPQTEMPVRVSALI